MTVKIDISKPSGRIKAPPSKSMAHRYLICAALSKGSTVMGVDYSKDIEATLQCLKAIGAKCCVTGDGVSIGGINVDEYTPKEILPCNESGSTLRFLIPLCLLFGKKITLMGSKRLFERSLSVYEQICNEQGIEYTKTDNSITLCGKLKAGNYKVRGDISSQFISGLMFALPLLSNDSTIEIEGDLESGSYLSLTIKALAQFGVKISRLDEHTIYIKGNQKYKSSQITVEGDYSNAAFFEALNLFGGNVVVTGLKKDSVQGDRVYKDILPLFKKTNPTVDISDCPDLAPIFMAVSAALNGAHFTGTKRLRIKESDRGAAMATELAKFGCKVTVLENDIYVEKGISKPSAVLFGHNDHRIVMSLAVLCTLTGGTITNAEAVAKSLPDFFERLKKLGVNLEVEKDI